jgi:hypothetical protein
MVCFLLCSVVDSHAQEEKRINDWENPDVVGIHKESAHATLFLAQRNMEIYVVT